jgi:thiol-disulfide isomerase/thioredoxin
MRFSTFLSLLLVIAAMPQAICQTLTLTGRLKSASCDSIELNEPFDGNYYKNNSFYVHPDAKGDFHLSIPAGGPKFLLLLYKEKLYLLLLSPGRPLHVAIRGEATQPLVAFSGKAKEENELIQRLNLVEEDSLPFMKALKGRGYDSFVGWSMDSILRIELPHLMQSLDSSEQMVGRARLNGSVKDVLDAELRYYYAHAILNGPAGWLENPRQKNYAAFYTRYVDTITDRFPLPTKEVLDISLSANAYLEAYMHLRFLKLVYDYRTDPDKERAANVFQQKAGVSIKDLQVAGEDERYTVITQAKALLPSYAWERELAGAMIRDCAGAQLVTAAKWLQFIRSHFPEGAYLSACEAAFAPLKQLRALYGNNLDIRMRPDYQHLHSLSDIMAPYKGKVVLVDLWFIHCPHCMEDMHYEPALKGRLKGQDVVFLYIAAEEDKQDDQWRDFILINDLTGEHIRQTPAQMGLLWNALGIRDQDQGYPHYFIFDKSGNLAEKNAQRPSQGDSLYNQLVAALRPR